MTITDTECREVFRLKHDVRSSLKTNSPVAGVQMRPVNISCVTPRRL